MLASTPLLVRRIAQSVGQVDTQDDTRIDADPGLESSGDLLGDHPRLGDDDVPPPGMQGMYYLG